MPNALTVWCAAAALTLAANVALAQPKPKPLSAYEALNDVLVIKDMQDLGMQELADALAAEDAKATDVSKMTAAIYGTIAEASRLPDPDARDKVLERILKKDTGLFDKVLPQAKADAEKPDSSVRVRMDYLRLRLLRAKTLGITRVDPYANQVLYLLDSESDRAKILEYVREAHKHISTMAREIAEERERMAKDDEAQITGAVRQLGQLSEEVKYNEAWMRLYEGIATPTDAANQKARNSLLTQAVTLVADWATSAAPSKKKAAVGPGIQQNSLLISGIASRELKEAEKAKGYLQQLLTAGVPAARQAQALFEMAHLVVDEGKLESGLAAIKEFQEKVAADKLLKELGIDMQATLLTSHLYDNLASAAAAGDAKKAQEYVAKSAQALVDFVKKYPDSLDAFLRLIERKFQGKDTKSLPLELQIMLVKRITDPNEAVKKLEEIVGMKPAPAPAAMLDALMELALRYHDSGQLLQAARRYRRVAQEFPKEPAAAIAARNAVACLDKGVTDGLYRPGTPEFAEYTLCLEVQQKGWGSEKDNRDDAFRLGRLYEQTNQFDKAVEEYEKIPAASGVYAPAKFRSLSIRGTALLNGQGDEKSRAAKAQAFVQDVKAFHGFVIGFKSDDKDKLADVRGFGPEADLLAAQVTLEVIKDNQGARKAAEQVLQDWSDASQQVRGQVDVVIIMGYLNDGNVEEVVKRVNDPTKQSDYIVSRIADQLKARVDKCDPVTEKAQREKVAAEYARFMEDTYRRAMARFKAATKPADTAWIDAQMFEYTRGLAGAMEESSDRAVLLQALKHYQKLLTIRKDDAVVVRGIARCSRKIGNISDAMSNYNKLVNGLTERNYFYWQANAERVELAVEVYAKNADKLRTTLLVIEQARENDPGMGGPALKARFEKAKAQATAALAIAPEPVETRPASAPAPATAPAK